MAGHFKVTLETMFGGCASRNMAELHMKKALHSKQGVKGVKNNLLVAAAVASLSACNQCAPVNAAPRIESIVHEETGNSINQGDQIKAGPGQVYTVNLKFRDDQDNPTVLFYTDGVAETLTDENPDPEIFESSVSKTAGADGTTIDHEVYVEDEKGAFASREFSVKSGITGTVTVTPSLFYHDNDDGTKEADIDFDVDPEFYSAVDNVELWIDGSYVASGSTLDDVFGLYDTSSMVGDNVPVEVKLFKDSDYVDSLYGSMDVLNTAPDEPVGSKGSTIGGSEGLPVTFYVSSDDDDGDTGLTYRVRDLPDGASFNPNTGYFEWTPDSDDGDNDPTIYGMFFDAYDGHDYSEELHVVISVNNTL